MSTDTKDRLSAILLKLIEAHVGKEGLDWLMEKARLISSESSAKELNTAFSAIPRKINKDVCGSNEEEQISTLLPGFSVSGWDTHRLSRVWLLMQVNAADKEKYISKIESLFNAAEMNELVALYSALPLLEYPEEWTARCAEGIRSNIGSVLEAIMLNNPYPSTYLSEPAWNQMVLKAFFTEKEISRIWGLNERANEALASTLLDYAHERMAAKRKVNEQLWPLIERFKTLAPADKNN
jgi:hypothetical protein